MNDLFDHFLITRFNLRSDQSNWKKDKSNSSTRSDEWLNNRLELFQKYCLPSVVKQTNNNFRWLIYFDSHTSESHRDEIKKILDPHKKIIIKYVNGYNEFLSVYTDDILKSKADNIKYVITSRVDNDDVLHKDFINTVQKQFTSQEFIAVNFIKTYHYKITQPEKLYINFRFSNQFISLIEKAGNNNIIGCYARGDRFWNKKGEIIQISNGVMCMEIIHDKNLLNDLNGFPLFRKRDLSDFQLIKKVNTFSLKDYIMVWRMSWKKLLIYLIKYKNK